MSASSLPIRSFRRSALQWLPAFAIQIAILVFFVRSFLFIVSGQNVWAVSDDIYISACYARTLATGHGLLWFPGAMHVEGFSNPLWVGVLALIRFLPFFGETSLGAFVFLVNAILLGLSWALMANTIPRYLDPAKPAPPLTLILSLIAVGAGSLPYWLSEGFESGLVVFFMMAGFRIAANSQLGPRDAFALGALTGLAFWTRMDGALYMIGPWLLVLLPLLRKPRALAILLVTASAMFAALFIARRLYYGQWLPNTYYLKIEGWKLRDRLRIGARQNWPELPAIAACWALLAFPAIRRGLGPALRPCAAALSTFTLSVIYSTHNGGDSWLAKLGQDRFTVVGAMALAFGLALAAAAFSGSTRRSQITATFAAAAIMISPAMLDPGARTLIERAADQKVPRREQSWIRYGMAFENVSKPGATIAISPAGAIVYFSHRGGVDLLGKNDPIPARRPVNVRNGLPGHNKRYEFDVMKARNPDFSREAPDASIAGLFQHVRSGGNYFWARKDSAYVLWDKLTVIQP